MKTLNFYGLAILSFVTLMLFLSSCEKDKKDKDKKDPVIKATQMTALSADQIKVSAKISAIGDYKILDYGFVFGFGNEESEIDFQSKISLGSQVVSDTISSIISNNIFYSNYYQNKCFAKAYITNEKGTVYSNVISTTLIGVKLDSISATHGFPGDTITLYGKNFISNPQSNIVLFNSTTATVISGTLTTLQVIVPSMNGGGANNPVDISLFDVSVLELVFSYDFYASGFSPHNGIWGTRITIAGSFYMGVEVYFDNTYVDTFESKDYEYLVLDVPIEHRKKSSKLIVKGRGQVAEVPGGEFRMNDLVIDSLAKWEYNNGDVIVFTGQNFHPYQNVLMLSNGSTFTSSYCSSSFANFSISGPIGSYTAKITNRIDTITLPSQIVILGK